MVDCSKREATEVTATMNWMSYELESNIITIVQIMESPGHPLWISGTMGTNLDLFKANSDKAIWAVLELSHLKTFVSSLDKGLDHEVQDGGENPGTSSSCSSLL
ncbi:hypothetical protein HPB50_013130 [Hyalomma asiaticum]|uniref:Uncharacterized protein n=1 Tax=Hyalomma asiaticum TaxID=266040 RepID=A0ACB7RP52_HYAAI|nr:hypothetical protein HPB50_013130 [Hyalomma asiaticum]